MRDPGSGLPHPHLKGVIGNACTLRGNDFAPDVRIRISTGPPIVGTRDEINWIGPNWPMILN